LLIENEGIQEIMADHVHQVNEEEHNGHFVISKGLNFAKIYGIWHDFSKLRGCKWNLPYF